MGSGMVEHTPESEHTLREQRQHTIDRLCELFAQDRLTLEELERRIDVAERTLDRSELGALLADLQPRTPAVAGTSPLPATRGVSLPIERNRNGTILAIMGAAERRGAWHPAEHNFVLCLMGGADLDFREVQLPPGVTEVFVIACMGGCEIVVPPDLQVEVNGVGIMGGFGHRAPGTRPGPNMPLLRINGFALMGGVDVNTRLPGETARDAKRRERRERRERRNW
jgi:hypothetical protein